MFQIRENDKRKNSMEEFVMDMVIASLSLYL
jgi:hypothetical protein